MFLETRAKGLKLSFLSGIINLEFLDPRDSTNSSPEVPLKLKAESVFMCVFPWKRGRARSCHQFLKGVH